MISWFLKAIGHNAWVEIISDSGTEQEIDSTLMNIWSVVDRASLQWQKNCINTIKKSIKYISPDSKWNTIDEDMSLRLLRLTSDFSSDDMQELVAKILAWEYNQPWRFSLRTLDVVRNLTKKDIELFEKFCWYVFNWKNFFADWYNLNSKNLSILEEQWIGYDNFLYLQDIWLVGWRIFWQNCWEKWDTETIYQYPVSIQNYDTLFVRKWFTVIHGLWNLTKAWEELLHIVQFQFNDILKDLTIDHFNQLWFKENARK